MNEEKKVKYGEIYFYDFGEHEGSIQNGLRPAVVIQDNKLNDHGPTTIIAAITSVTKKLYLPSHILIGEQFGLTKPSIPIPPPLADCLKEVKAKSQSPFVVANRDGEPLSYTQFQRVWKYIVTRSNKERTYVRYVNGQKIKHTVTPVLGEKAPHNGKVVYSLDFQVTPHQLRHTYITNLIYAGVDPKTVQYLAGHENSKITMDIYAKVKYNSPDALSTIVNNAFNNMYAKAE